MTEKKDNGIFYLSKKDREKLFKLFDVKNIKELRMKLNDDTFKLKDAIQIELETKDAIRRIKQADAIYKEWKNKFIDTFGVEPSEQALNALKQKKANYEKTLTVAMSASDAVKEKILDEKWQMYGTIKKYPTETYVKCDLCKWYNNYPSQLEAEHDLKRHIGACHMEKLLT